MADNFTYDGSKIVVCNGTSGSPKTFADMYDADLAGTLTVLDAGIIDADPDAFSLDTSLQPADSRQMKLTISTSADRVGATVTIIGTDLDGDAIVETNLDIATANSVPVETALKFAGVDASGISVAGMTNDDTITITQPRWGVVWEMVEDSQYEIDCDVDFGDGSTPTYLASEREHVRLKGFKIKNNTTVRLGEKVGDYAINGSWWEMTLTERIDIIDIGQTTAIFLRYDSRLNRNGAFSTNFNDGTTDIIKSELSTRNSDSSSYLKAWIWQNNANVSFDDVNFTDVHTLTLSVTPTKMLNVHVHSTQDGLSTNGSITAKGINITNVSSIDVVIVGSTANVTLIDPKVSVSTLYINHTDGWLKEQYTFNLHVRDKDGANLASVTCLLEDTTDTQVFSVSTAADGTITEQTVDYKKWEGTSETLTEYTPHKLTLSKANYETLVIEEITMDEPKVLELELQPYGRESTV